MTPRPCGVFFLYKDVVAYEQIERERKDILRGPRTAG